ncbi:MAG: tetratricopeptide repeat protein [Phycisphaerae bacterium]|nr:tetratricopeptide repeat protein [Phycisphaerae bacterium]
MYEQHETNAARSRASATYGAKSNGEEHSHVRAAPERQSGWLRTIPPIVVAFCTGAVFLPVLLAGFVFWDDYALLVANTRYQHLSQGGLAWMFTTSFAGHWQPLTWLSFWLDYQIAGVSALMFHLSNLVLHIVNAVLFYFVAERLLNWGKLHDRQNPAYPRLLAGCFAALFFSLHPLRVESVAWIAERRDVLSGAFFLLAILAWLQFVEATGQSRAHHTNGTSASERSTSNTTRSSSASSLVFWYGLGLASFALSLGAKASGAMLPVVLLVMDIWPFRRTTCTGKTRMGCWSRLLLEKLPFFGLGIAAGWRALIAQDRGGALYDLSHHGVLDRVAQAIHGLAFYLNKTVAPFGLGPLYEIPADSGLFGGDLIATLVVLAFVVIAVAFLSRRRPAIGIAFLCYVVLIGPVLGFFQSGPQFVADRYSYLATMPLALLAGGGLLQFMRTRSWQGSSRTRAIVSLIMVAILVGLGHLSMAQTAYWDNALALWSRGVAVSPESPVVHTNLADAYARFGQEGIEPAIRHYEIALSLNPKDVVALDHLGRVLERQGRSVDAAQLYARALSIDPTREQAALALGQILAASGRGAQAAEVWREGLQHHPDSLELMDALADLLATYPDQNIRNGAEAVRLAEIASAARGDQDPFALVRLATAWAQLGKFDMAVRVAEKAMTLGPADDAGFRREVRYRIGLFTAGKHYVAPGGTEPVPRQGLP